MGIEGVNNSVQVVGGVNCCQIGYFGVNDYYFGGWNFVCCCNLFGKELIKFMCCFNDSVVFGDVGY